MAFNEFRKGRDDRPAAPPSTSASGGVGALTAFIDQGSEFTGKLSFKDTVRIDGRFEGEITSENTLIVGETGQVHANIQSEIVIISGEVVGDITARTQVTLHKTGKVTGNIETQRFAVEEGAKLNGQIRMDGKPGGGSSKPADKGPEKGGLQNPASKPS